METLFDHLAVYITPAITLDAAGQALERECPVCFSTMDETKAGNDVTIYSCKPCQVTESVKL